MTYNIISTGSHGNAVLINDSILIDIGVPWKKLEPYADKISIVLLTHVHGDHFRPSTVRALHRERPAVRWGCCEWLVKSLLDAGVDKRVIDIFRIGIDQYKYYAGIGTFLSEEIPHNVRNCAWHYLDRNEEERLFYATDCSTLDGIEAKDYDLYLIECNYEDKEIEARIEAKEAAGVYSYEKDVRHNHLSKKQAENWLAANMGPHSQYVFLHQHQERVKK